MNDIMKIVKYFEEFGLSIKCLTNFEIQKFYENKPKFNSVYSRNN